MNIEIEKDNVLSVITTVSEKLGGTLKKFYGAATLDIQTPERSGVIKAYDLFPGMGAMTYDFKKSGPLTFIFTKGTSDPMYFLFCLKGYVIHKFEHETESVKLESLKNIIIRNSANGKSFIEMPKDVGCKLSLIVIQENRIKNLETNQRSVLATYLGDLFTRIDESSTYKYQGAMLPKAADLVQLLINNEKEGVVGRLLSESLILQILASQIEEHDKDTKGRELDIPLKEEEIDKIMAICEYISNNISQNLSMQKLQEFSGMSPKKIQLGFRFLYQKSLNDYTSEVRLEHARELIENTNLNISEVVYSSGLNNRSHFSKIFKKRYGILPSAYRKSFIIDLKK